MVDIVDASTRSRWMRAIKSRGNFSTEQIMVRILRAHRIKGWRRHFPIEGTPDFCWPEKKVALFVDGCFWHGCPFCYNLPKTNKKYWLHKVKSNQKRDNRVNRFLRRKGWSVIRVRDCRINRPATIAKIQRALANRKR